MDEIAPLLHLPDGGVHPQEHGLIQVGVGQLPQLLHPVKVPVRLYVVRHIQDLVQQGHIRLASGVPENGLVYLIRFPKNILGNTCPRLGVKQFYRLALQAV